MKLNEIGRDSIFVKKWKILGMNMMKLNGMNGTYSEKEQSILISSVGMSEKEQKWQRVGFCKEYTEIIENERK